MAQFGKELQMYANNGMRSAAAWLTFGRQIASGSKPCAGVMSRGATVELFTKDQTELRTCAQDPQEKSAK
jgi:hypothetical protein